MLYTGASNMPIKFRYVVQVYHFIVRLTYILPQVCSYMRLHTADALLQNT